MKQQKGFVLVSVLIITTITTMLAFSQISENRLEERIGGNQQKELNARLAAEKGLIAAFEYIEEQNQGNVSNSALLDIFKQAQTDGDYSFLKVDDYSKFSFKAVTYDAGSNTFTLISEGEVDGATSYLKAEIEAVESSEYFKDAIVGCNSVDVSGSAMIDSYSGNAYPISTGNPPPVNSNANVKVIDGEAALPNGNSNGNGNGNNKGIYGNVTANTITGNTALIKGENIEGEEVPYVTGYVGDDNECDPLDIADEMAKISDQAIGGSDFSTANSTTNFGTGGETPEKLTVFGESTDVYVYDNFNLTDENVLITGDVTLYIAGDLTISNGNSGTFTLANSNSSLTIFIAGKLDLTAKDAIFAGEFVSSDSIPLTVYSSNATEDAVTLRGQAAIYMNLYAPLGSVHYNGQGDIMGAVRAKNIDIGGNGAIHYDEGLAGIGGSGEAASVSYSSIYYYYPE